MKATAGTRAELAAVIEGLREDPPRVAPQYLYDAAGSRLFQQITRTPEYYPTRTELGILRERGERIASRIAPGCVLIELGCGSPDKAFALLAHLVEPRLYRPIDISQDAIERTARVIAESRPGVEVSAYRGDLMDERAYRDLPSWAPRVLYYPGSTIGNWDPPEAIACLRALRGQLGSGDFLLLAVDLVKDTDVLWRAYNDRAGRTAAFNKNLLRHLNARFEANFDVEAFEHLAFYDARERRVEMHLVPRRRVRARLGGETFSFTPSRPIHTERSYKFTLDDLPRIAACAGFVFEEVITDPRGWFAVALFRA